MSLEPASVHEFDGDEDALDGPSTMDTATGRPRVTRQGSGRSSWARQLRRPQTIVALVALVGVAVWWGALRSDGGSSASAATTTQLVTVTQGSLANTVSAEGTVAAAQTDDLSFASSGKVTAVNVKEGDTVTAGQVLATIDSASLQSDVTSAESTLANAEATLSDDQSSGASDSQITADQAGLTSAQDALTAAQQALAGAALTATFDGTVATVDITAGEQLASGGAGGTSTTGSTSGSGQSSSAIGSANGAAAAGGDSSSSGSSTAQIQVVSTGRYTVQLSVSSTDIGSVAVGQSATLTVSTSSSSSGAFPGGGAFPRFGGQGGTGNPKGNAATGNAGTGPVTTGATATGAVTEVSKVADASSGVATYPVTISFDAAKTDFYVGATVTGAISTSERTNVLQVPSRAITTTNGKSTVMVATDGTKSGATETRTVSTGLTANGQTEITAGLEAGDKVIVTVPGAVGGFGPPGGPGGFGGGGTRGGGQ